MHRYGLSVRPSVCLYIAYLEKGSEFRDENFRDYSWSGDNGWDCFWVHGVIGVNSYSHLKIAILP